MRRARTVAEPTQVDDLLNTRLPRVAREVGRGPGIAIDIVAAAAAAHRVDQVVGGAHALERLGQALALDGVALEALHRGREIGAVGITDERAHAAAAGEQLVEEVGADVARGAGQEDRFWVSCHRGHRARYGRGGEADWI
jgi:hypothetical protein